MVFNSYFTVRIQYLPFFCLCTILVRQCQHETFADQLIVCRAFKFLSACSSWYSSSCRGMLSYCFLAQRVVYFEAFFLTYPRQMSCSSILLSVIEPASESWIKITLILSLTGLFDVYFSCNSSFSMRSIYWSCLILEPSSALCALISRTGTLQTSSANWLSVLSNSMQNHPLSDEL